MAVPHSGETWDADRTRLTGRLATSCNSGGLSHRFLHRRAPPTERNRNLRRKYIRDPQNCCSRTRPTTPKLLSTPQKFCRSGGKNRQIPLTTHEFPCYPASSQEGTLRSSHGLDRNRVTGRQLTSIALHSTCRPHDRDERWTPFIQWERRSGLDDPFPRHPPEQVGRQGPRLRACPVSSRTPLTWRIQRQRHASGASPIAPASLHRGLAGSGIRGPVGAVEPAQPVQPGARRSGRFTVCGCLPDRCRQGGPRRYCRIRWFRSPA